MSSSPSHHLLADGGAGGAGGDDDGGHVAHGHEDVVGLQVHDASDPLLHHHHDDAPPPPPDLPPLPEPHHPPYPPDDAAEDGSGRHHYPAAHLPHEPFHGGVPAAVAAVAGAAGAGGADAAYHHGHGHSHEQQQQQQQQQQVPPPLPGAPVAIHHHPPPRGPEQQQYADPSANANANANANHGHGYVQRQGQGQGPEGYGHGHVPEAVAATAGQQQWEYAQPNNVYAAVGGADASQDHQHPHQHPQHQHQHQYAYHPEGQQPPPPPPVAVEQQPYGAHAHVHAHQHQQQQQPYGHPAPEHGGGDGYHVGGAGGIVAAQAPDHQQYGTDGTYQAQVQAQYYQHVGGGGAGGEAPHHLQHPHEHPPPPHEQYPANNAGMQMHYHHPHTHAQVQAQAQARHAYPHHTEQEHAEAMAAANTLHAAATGGYGGDHGNLYHGGGSVETATAVAAGGAGGAEGGGGRRRRGQHQHHHTPVPSDEAWDRRFQELKEFYRQFGHSDVPQTYQLNKPLGKWVGKQREKWKIRQETGSSTLTDERIRKLETVEFKLFMGKGQHAKVHGLYMTERKTEEFNKRFQELVEFKAQHGHCQVPFTDSKHNGLAQWCTRFNRKLRSHRITGPLAMPALPTPGDDGAIETTGGTNGEGNSASATTQGGATATATAKEKEMRILLERKKKLEDLGGFDFDYGFHRKEQVADGPRNNSDRWNEKFEALTQYKERVGNADVPSTYREGETKKDASLATWVAKQRELWRNKQQGKGRKLSDERESKLASLGFNFEILDAIWEAKYAELKQYREKYGTADMTEKTGTRSLWQWCKRQREAFHQFLQDQTGPMTNDRIAKMELLSFDWKYERTNELLEAKKPKGTGPTEKTKRRVGRPKKKDAVSTTTTTMESAMALAEAAAEAAAALEQARGVNAGGVSVADPVVQVQMPQSEIEDVEAALRDAIQRHGSRADGTNDHTDGKSNADPDRWLAMFQQLIQYKKDNGHCRVPQRERGYDGLGLWVKVQRLEYRNLVDNKTGPGKTRLSEWRLELLQKIDFIFEAANSTTFEGRLEQLRVFKREFGHTKVPQNFQRSKSLGKWVSKIREQYRFKEEGKKCRLTEDQINQLDSVGFQWRVGRGKNRRSWDESYQDLLKFHQEHGHFNVPINYAPDPGLASWANLQRSNYRSQVHGRNRKGKTVREQNQKLIEIGFNFHVDPEGEAVGEEGSPGRKRKHTTATATDDATTCTTDATTCTTSSRDNEKEAAGDDEAEESMKPAAAKRTKNSDDSEAIDEGNNRLQEMGNETIGEIVDTACADI